MISLQLNVGSRISLARSAMGRAYIAGTNAVERAQILEMIEARTDPADWPRIRDEIADAADQIRRRGFYANLGSWQSDVNSVAVPYRSPQGDAPMLAFNLGGPAYILPRDRIENDLGPRLVEMVQKVGRIGG
jgi:DNA-binding IclR family transcriptional regulator